MPDASSLIAFATSAITLACAVAKGPFRDVGWITASSRLLDLSEKLCTDGDEGEARAFLRELATSKIMRAKRFRNAISSGLPWMLNRLSLAALMAMAVTSVVIIAQTWMGGVHPFVMSVYLASLFVMCTCSVASFAVFSFRKRKRKRRL